MTRRRPRRTPLLGDFVSKEYWPAAAPHLSTDWRTRSAGIVREIVDALGSRKLADLSPKDVDVWWGGVCARARAPRSANLYLVRLRHLCRKALEWGYITEDPTRFTKKAREPRGRVRYLTDEQRTRLIERAHPRLRLYILAAVYTAARRRSLWALRWNDVDFVRGTITFPNTKNGDDHVLPLHPELRKVFEGLPREGEHPLPRMTPHGITVAFRRLTKRLGLDDFRFHDLRHDVASRLAMAGVNQRVIQDVLGHRDPRMSARYTHIAESTIRQVLEETLTGEPKRNALPLGASAPQPFAFTPALNSTP